jgi:chromosome segregation protein
MYLKAVQMKGFKSFPSRTRLDFGPGVSVIVGPNGSGKSNVSDAIVWALGEQSAAAVRGRQMQDLLFGGAEGVPSAAAAEVELIFDNSDGRLDTGFSELSITRRLSRDGEGEYRINGARCRLVDVIEVLSDTGLGKEMHSVLSQGKVDEIVASKPKDRRLLIEEAAGLGKHRKRRRRAQLKLAKARENLDRVLDVEREARSHLRPLKRQAEAAETHARLELQADELRAEETADRLLNATNELGEATRLAAEAREVRERTEAELAAVAQQREVSERQIAAEAARREKATESLFSLRSAVERVEGQRDSFLARERRLRAEIDRAQAELGQLTLDVPATRDDSRIAELEVQLAEVEREGRAEIEAELGELRASHQAELERLTSLELELAVAAEADERSEHSAVEMRQELATARKTLAEVEQRCAHLEGELGAVDQFLRGAVGEAGAEALGAQFAVEPGYELALAAVLGRRLRAALVDDLVSGDRFLDSLGEKGGSALLRDHGAGAERSDPPQPGAQTLASKLKVQSEAQGVVDSLLRDVWVVESLTDLAQDFNGVAVTRSGRVYFASSGELRQSAGGGEQRILAERNRRSSIAEQLETARAERDLARKHSQDLEERAATAEVVREEAGRVARAARIARDELAGAVQGQSLAIERRIEAGIADGPIAVRRAGVEAELRSERAHAEALGRAAELQVRRRNELELRLATLRSAMPPLQGLAEQLAAAATAANERTAVLAGRLDGDRAAGESLAQELRAHATAEAKHQLSLREQGELVTQAEVRAQRARDLHAEVDLAAKELSQRLGRPVAASAAPLDEPRRAEIADALTRITRRRELLGPVNPLAKDEYASALAHVEELEGQRDDLETALKELGSLIKEIDRTIRTSFEETFEATSGHFEELVERLFPGGHGRLQLVAEERPKPTPALTAETGDDAGDELEDRADEQEDELGVEIKVQLPGSKSGRVLTLLSGGERSLVALAFLFSVFLTRPCPFYVFDEAEAALDDINIDRLVALLREHSATAQFIVITHQKRTMDAADCLYGVSMGKDGISKVVTRRMPSRNEDQSELALA